MKMWSLTDSCPMLRQAVPPEGLVGTLPALTASRTPQTIRIRATKKFSKAGNTIISTPMIMESMATAILGIFSVFSTSATIPIFSLSQRQSGIRHKGYDGPCRLSLGHPWLSSFLQEVRRLRLEPGFSRRTLPETLGPESQGRKLRQVQETGRAGSLQGEEPSTMRRF